MVSSRVMSRQCSGTAELLSKVMHLHRTVSVACTKMVVASSRVMSRRCTGTAKLLTKVMQMHSTISLAKVRHKVARMLEFLFHLSLSLVVGLVELEVHHFF